MTVADKLVVTLVSLVVFVALVWVVIPFSWFITREGFVVGCFCTAIVLFGIWVGG